MAIVVLIVAVVFVGLLIASFFVRRHAESPTPRTDWTATGEAFRDPSTGRLMRVWIDQAGARRYVPEGELPPEP
jgi:uncharacterized membrane protein